MKYKKAYAQVVLFDNSDVVTASAMGPWDQDAIDKEFGCDGRVSHVDKNL